METKGYLANRITISVAENGFIILLYCAGSETVLIGSTKEDLLSIINGVTFKKEHVNYENHGATERFSIPAAPTQSTEYIGVH